jgi:hypothetical protein
MAAKYSHSGIRMKYGSPDAAGISATIKKTARQRRAIALPVLEKACIHLQ